MQFDKKQRFSIRKLSLGVCSVLVGIALFGAGHALAEETSPAASQATTSVLAKEVEKFPILFCDSSQKSRKERCSF